MKKSLLAIGVLGLSGFAASTSSNATAQDVGHGLEALAATIVVYNAGYLRAKQKYEPWRVDAARDGKSATVTTYLWNFTLKKPRKTDLYVRVDEGTARRHPLPSLRHVERMWFYGLQKDPLEERARNGQ